MSEPSSALRSLWRNVSDALKKEFTRHISITHRSEFQKWTKGIGGFRPDSFATRSSKQLGQMMDDHLFRIEEGRFAAGLIGGFLCAVHPDLNRAFTKRFLERATADRQATANEIRGAALQDLEKVGHAPEILSLYAAALPCVEPRYSAETPPEDAFLSAITVLASEQAPPPIAAPVDQPPAADAPPHRCCFDAIQNAIRAIDLLCEPMGRFSETIEQVRLITEPSEFGESKTISQRLSELEAHRRQVAEGMKSVQTALDDLRAIQSPLSVCALFENVTAALAADRKDADSFLRLRKVLVDVLSQHERARRELQTELTQKRDFVVGTWDLSGETVQALPDFRTATTLCRLQDAADGLDREHAKAQQTRTALAAKEKLQLRLLWTELQASATVCALRDFTPSVRLIEESLAQDSPTVETVRRATRAAEQIREDLRTRPELWSIDKLARTAASPILSTRHFLLLAEKAAQAGDDDVSGLVLLVAHHLPGCIATIQSTPQTFAAICDVLPRLVAHYHPSITLENVLAEMHWLAEIPPPPALACKFALLLAAAAGAGGGEAAALMKRYDAMAQLAYGDTPEWNSVARAVMEGRRIATTAKEVTPHAKPLTAEIDELLRKEHGRYVHIQCASAHHFTHLESDLVFPVLESIWAAVRNHLSAGDVQAARRFVQAQDADRIYRNAAKQHNQGDHPFYTKKITVFTARFLNLVAAHTQTYGSDASQPRTTVTVAIDRLVGELERSGGRAHYPALAESLAAILGAQQAVPEPVASTLSRADDLALRSSRLSLLCQKTVVRLCANDAHTAGDDTLRELAESLSSEVPVATAIRALADGACWLQVSRHTQCGDRETDDLILRAPGEVERITSSLRKRFDAVGGRDGSDRNYVEALLDAGRYRAVETLVGVRESSAREALEQTRTSVTSDIRGLVNRLSALKEAAYEENRPESWVASVTERCNSMESVLLRLKKELRPSGEKEVLASISTGRQAVEVLELLVVSGGSTFTEFDSIAAHLPGCAGAASGRHHAVDAETAMAKAPDLINAWRAMLAPGVERAALQRAWIAFGKEFTKACNLYRDETRTFVTIPIPLYPMPAISTGFHKPRSDYLRQPLHLHFFDENVVTMPNLQVLEEWMTRPDQPGLHIVFALVGRERAERFLHYNPLRGTYLLVDESFLFSIACHPRHDVPLRQALYSAVKELATSSPFVTDGYCHEDHNIFIGRDDDLKKLETRPLCMIYGGRRIGKTSLLRALETRLSRRSFAAVYVYAARADKPGDDPDLLIAREIVNQLGQKYPAANVHPVNSMSDFYAEITRVRATVGKIAILLDEVDDYIKKSRSQHGDTFPLASALRSITQSDENRTTYLVYAGYHQLFYESKLRKSVGAAHPFVNVAEPVFVRDLSPDDVQEMVAVGFLEMLGIEYDAEVPRLVYDKASGHPAFVQRFCQCLLARLSQRREPNAPLRIRSEDVSAVYDRDAPSPAEGEPFIYYVNETLGFNLSHLGRAVMHTLCQQARELIRPGQTAGMDFDHIRGDIRTYCDLLDIEPPTDEHLLTTIELLIMTSMVTQVGGAWPRYKISYATYVDILRRLDKLRKTEVDTALMQYDKMERERGVLL